MGRDEKNLFGRFWQAPEKKATVFLTAILLLGIFLLATANLPGVSDKVAAPAPENYLPETVIHQGERDLEKRLQQLLSVIEGVGRVDVSIFFASGTRFEYATNVTGTQRVVDEQDQGGGLRLTTENNTSDQFVLVRGSQVGGEQPVIIQERSPKIQGVLIVAEGAKNAKVKAKLFRAVETGLGIEAHRVQVLSREGR